MTDYYAILGVSRTAHESEIKRAYRRLAVQFHPDKNPTPEAESLFKLINEAYSVLGDRAQRQRYDQMMLDPLSQFVAADIQPKHRDPAYRRQRPAPPPFRKKESAMFELMKELHPITIWISRFTFFLTFMFFLDYVLPYRTDKEVVERFVAVKIKRSTAYHFAFLESGHKIKIYPHDEISLQRGDHISVTRTLLFKTTLGLTRDYDGQYIETGHMYRTHLFLPLILFIFSVVGLVFGNRVEFSFNVAIVNFIMLIINFVFL